MTNPSVSVLIAQWGKVNFTERAVASIQRSQYEGEIEILVWDNASPGGPGSLAQRKGITLIEHDENIGFGPAHNAMAERATGDYIIILNNDVVLDPLCIDRLVQAMGDPLNPGAVGPLYRGFDGTVLEAGGVVGNDASGWQLFKGTAPPPSLLRRRYEVHYASAACLMLEREVFLSLDGFDDRYSPAYYEDTDLCMKLRQQGHPVLVEPLAVCFHYEGATSGKDVTSGFKAYQVRNRSRFLRRWVDELQEVGEPASFGLAATQAIVGSAERSVLWVSPHLPRVDREAGHLRILRMIEQLQADGQHVAMWVRDPFDVDRYGRMLESKGVPWFGPVEKSRWHLDGSDPEILTGLDDVVRAVDWDSVIISFPDVARDLIPVSRGARADLPILIDCVDVHFIREERGLAFGVNPPGGGMSRRDELAIFRMSDGLITASAYETEVVREALPSVPVTSFPVAAEEPRIEERGPGSGALFLGNFNHAPNLDGVEWWIDAIQPRVRASLDDDSFAVRVVGTASGRHRFDWGGNADVAGWVEDLADEFRAARVFVVPLRYGAGTKGKITVAMAFGIPIVTTPIGAEGFFGATLESLVVAQTEDEFAEACVRLLVDDDHWVERREIAVAAAEEAWESQVRAGGDFTAWVRRRRPLATYIERGVGP